MADRGNEKTIAAEPLLRVGGLFTVFMHSHAERGNEKKLRVGTRRRSLTLRPIKTGLRFETAEPLLQIGNNCSAGRVVID